MSSVDEFQVSIAASALDPRDNCSFIHAIAVTQPVQSWTVIREQPDFEKIAASLKEVMPGLPPCPRVNQQGADIENIRDLLQSWLVNVLHFPGARESPTIRSFLCEGANIVPTYFQTVNWTNFANKATDSRNTGVSGRAHSLDEMEMDDMFDTPGDDDKDSMSSIDNDAVDTDDELIDEEAIPYAERYPPVDELPTKEDAIDLMDHEIEMVEDIGSLAQSMGASHLGRSLQLQAQIANMKQIQQQQHATPLSETGHRGIGVVINAPVTNIHSGGIGSAMKQSQQSYNNRTAGVGDSFHQAKPVSPPRLDSFKVIKVIGKGSFGKVFLVKEYQSGEMFALKVLKKDNIIKRNQVEHTKTERNVLGYVNHPFIVGLNMAFQSKNKLFFVLDYCAGGELFFHLGKLGKFAEPRACFYAAEITLAIEYVHNLDVIYRDLKPENVLLDARGHVRLTDFGLSKEGISDSSSGANSFCGTPEYLAPEILNRQGHGRAVDWWSLGALLYEMLTGLPPFYCRDREKLFEKIRRGELYYPRHLTPRSQSLLRGLLTRDPTKRLGSGERDAEEIKFHPFFAEIDWKKLANGDIAPPWNPTLTGSLDTSQFDAEFTNMPICSPSSMQVSFFLFYFMWGRFDSYFMN